MNNLYDAPFELDHQHVFLGEGHDKNERKTWAVIVLCSAMMLAEIIGGHLFGSLALVADGMHMSTHAGAMLIAALAYTYARKHANDNRFVFGTGKLGDLAGFSSAIILAMIALLIGYEAVVRLLSPIPISFSEAIPIAVVGLLVNIASAWLLSGGDHHGHSHGHADGAPHDNAAHDHGDEAHIIKTSAGVFVLSIFEDGVSPVFRIHAETTDANLSPGEMTVTTVRPEGTRQLFSFAKKADFLESTTDIPEPHAFKALVTLARDVHSVAFEEHAHHPENDGIDRRDHNMRAAYVHVIADAAVSVLAIIGLLLAKSFGWLWMDPLAGLVGALVIANWSYGLIRDTGANLMDVSPNDVLPSKVRAIVNSAGDKLIDLHVWRLGPGHFGAVVSVVTQETTHGPAFYQRLLRKVTGLSHITVEVHTPQSV
ncbi:CDF family Co(II)/Ni(II) efflux transporter DmeF [Glaciimonas immobilis]|uniref:Cation diffusion facilitator family transporter n=1 Tax=Glaciimonas immobilis TaxID=728004 RepID=A0A840RXQ2_9BURK|nr:CDF family Co(II)/Ni(II) efflux transporter DmeF [Glaciimonas immobilis]KAF3998363.1 CDF family Co(II)/Ni(II) efflux transporter DmeF [Glaciimonas immobilis]MBB5201992.1 cation diffusion facilitator family transporter [Glaciimonas immobilis]